MATGLLVAVQHVAACQLLVHTWGLGFMGAALASCWSNLLSLALLAGYVAAAGLGGCVWGSPSREAFAHWRQFAGLAYSSAGATWGQGAVAAALAPLTACATYAGEC